MGNLGARYRFAYGALGDNVNLGSRLEGLNREFGTEIIIGENTAELVGDAFRLRELDMVRVKGRRNAVRVYELLAKAGDALPEQVERVLEAIVESAETGRPQPVEPALGPYAAGLEAYRRMAWEGAALLFNRVLETNPEDGASRTMIERCRRYRQMPPPTDWDGVFEMQTK